MVVRPWTDPALARLATLFALGACASHPSPAVAPPPAARAADGLACTVGDSVLVRDVVYFGRNRPQGGMVTDTDWRRFLDEVVTPRFPDGYTVVEAVGHWRGRSGAVEQERTELLTLLHPGRETAARAVAEIAAEYKRRFEQEAVLRERTAVCARFD
jgi:hypothetical protein